MHILTRDILPNNDGNNIVKLEEVWHASNRLCCSPYQQSVVVQKQFVITPKN